MPRAISQQWRAQRGGAAVEFALLLTPLVLLAFGAVELGRAIYAYDTVVKSVRAAARLIAQRDPNQADTYEQALQQARCLAAYGVTDCATAGTPLAPGLSTTHVRICDRRSADECPDLHTAQLRNVATGAGTGTIDLVVVRIADYEFHWLGLPLTSSNAPLVFHPVQAVMRQGL